MAEFKRRHSDQTKRPPRQQISRLAFALAALLIAVTSASLLFVGFIASRASHRQAVQNEERLFNSALSHQLRSLVREQITISASDDSVRRLVRGFDHAYARASFDTLWSSYGHSKVMLISGEGNLVAESFRDYTHVITRPVTEVPTLVPVVEKLNGLYRRNRVRVPGGFSHRSLQGLDPSEYAVMGFARFDGKLALFGAMPVIPDANQATLPDGPPTLLLSAHYIEDALLRHINSQLNLEDFRFVGVDQFDEGAPGRLVVDHGGDKLGAFTWNSRAVGGSIWPTVIPVVALLSAALAVLAFGIAWRIGQLTSSLQASESQNRYLALHDTLTGLANRLRFNRELDAAVATLPHRPFAVIHCDLDHFKEVNDTFGHGAGDRVIKEVAQRLERVIGSGGVVCRIGGDEFTVIYRGPARRDAMVPLCEALVAAGSEPVRLGGGDIGRVGLSAGIALAPADGTTSEELAMRSDAALYHSKKLGRNRFSFHQDIVDAADAPRNLPLRTASAAPAE